MKYAVPYSSSYQNKEAGGFFFVQKGLAYKSPQNVLVGMSAEGGRRLWFGGDNLRLKLETGKMWGEVSSW